MDKATVDAMVSLLNNAMRANQRGYDPHVVTLIGRAMRADQRSHDTALSTGQRGFHAGMREGLLQAIAVFSNVEVKDIREGVLGKGNPYPEFSHHE